MGTMNLLQASVNGKLGKMYGKKDKDKKVICLIPKAPKPHNPTQTKCVRAFEVLCRLSAGISRSFFQFMGLSKKEMLPHNAVAQFLKPAIKNKTFQLSNCAEVIPADDTCTISEFSVDVDSRSITLRASTSLPVDKRNGSAWFVGIFDNTGKCVLSVAPENQSFTRIVTTLLFQSRFYYGVAFRADVQNKKVFLHGWTSTELPYVFLGRVLIDNFPTSRNYSISGNRLVINDSDVSVSGGRVVVNL